MNRTKESVRQEISDLMSVAYDGTGLAAPEAVERLTKQALALAEQTDPNDIVLKAPVTIVQGIRHSLSGSYFEAMNAFLSVIDAYEDGVIDQWLVHAHYYLGTTYYHLGLFTESLECHLKQLEFATHLGVKGYMASAMRRIGVANSELGHLNLALKYYERSIGLFTELGDSSGLASIYNNIALIMLQKDKPPEALDYGLRAVSEFEKFDRPGPMSELQNTVAIAYLAIGDYDNALSYANSSLESAVASGWHHVTVQSMLTLGTVLLKMGDFGQSKKMAHDALDMAEKADNFKEEADACQLLGDIYEAQGDNKTALMYQKRLHDRYVVMTEESVKSRFEALETIHRTKQALLNFEREKEMRLQEKNRREMQSRFISMLVHDFRNPVASIKAYLYVARRLLDKPEIEKTQEKLQQIDEIVGDLNEQINDLLALGRIDAISEIHKEMRDIVMFSRQFVLDFEEKNEDDLHQFVISSIEDTLAVGFDVQLMERVLDNLLSNAVKYSPDGGQIRVGLKKSNNFVYLTVSDEGIGIPEDEIDSIFEFFSRASNTGSILGTGLGLHTVRHIVQLHGGEVSCQSQLGQETEITVTLPLS